MQDSSALIFARQTDFPTLSRLGINTLQVNLGYLCNLSCVHCHVNAGPTRTELMDKDTINDVLDVLQRHGIKQLDLTGGAPEMNPHFRELVERARAMNVEVIDRCNLTILLEPGYEDMVDFLARHQVRVVASLPCYLEDNVDKQRGKGVYQGSIEAIKRLNNVGYGKAEGELILDLVYNPTGPSLPPEQAGLQADYKTQLANRFGITFNELLTITNMPISRFGAVLMAHNQFDDYMQLLKDNHNDDNLAAVMCRDTISVDYQGNLYDCDFNQMLKLPLVDKGRKKTLSDLLNWDATGAAIQIADHCYGCTAGSGSSCGGALS